MAEWFRHDTGSRNDIKLRRLAREYGLAGIGAFWVAVEVLYENGGTADEQDLRDELDFITPAGMLDGLAKYDLISISSGKVTSHRVLDEIAFQTEAKQKKSEAGRKGMASRWGNRVITPDNTAIASNNNGYQAITPDNTIPDHTNKKDISDSKESSIKKESNSVIRFRKPSVEEIRAYCQERNNGINAESFYDFYESKDWMIGKNRMKDWKAAVRTWERSEGSTESGRKKMTTDRETRMHLVNPDGSLNLLGGRR